jgi:hypothetical protein
MSDLARSIVIAAILLGGALVVRGTFGTDRFELIQAVGGSVYRLDRLTGSVVFCTPAACRPLPMFVPAPATAPGEKQPPAQSGAETPQPPKTNT